jgi:hypothetical protein
MNMQNYEKFYPLSVFASSDKGFGFKKALGFKLWAFGLLYQSFSGWLSVWVLFWFILS